MNTEQHSAKPIEAVTVSAGEEEYAVGIRTVREIRGYSNVTALARTDPSGPRTPPQHQGRTRNGFVRSQQSDGYAC